MSIKKLSSTKNSEIFKTPLYQHQKVVVNFLRDNEISIITGFPGTAKDFCCLYRGLEGVIKKEFEQLVLIKPIIEIGRSMGYLKGEEVEKYAPYIKSFTDNITKMIGSTETKRLGKKIKYEPINFVRGSTWDYSCIILSEAQNCTLHELISVITRVAKSSKIFLNGDLTQSDIGKRSGLKDLMKILQDVDGVGMLELGDEHQVRNPMIIEITKKYRTFLKNKNE
jgi:phosphate starvation-inducible PhoH-like protein